MSNDNKKGLLSQLGAGAAGASALLGAGCDNKPAQKEVAPMVATQDTAPPPANQFARELPKSGTEDAIIEKKSSEDDPYASAARGFAGFDPADTAKLKVTWAKSSDKPKAPAALTPTSAKDGLVICYGAVPLKDLSGYHTVIVHPGNFKEGELGELLKTNTRLRGGAKTVVAGYISAAQIAGWEKKDYETLLSKPGIVASHNKQWDSTILNVTHDAWSGHMDKLIAKVKASGANAVFIDNVDDIIAQSKTNPKAIDAYKSLLKKVKDAGLDAIGNRGFTGESLEDCALLSECAKEKLIAGVLVESGNANQRNAALKLKAECPDVTLYSVSYIQDKKAKAEAYEKDRKDGFIPYHPANNNLQSVEPEPRGAERGR